MISAFKKRWEIQHNWQLIYPLLGIIATVFCAYLITNGILKDHLSKNPNLHLILLIGIGLTVYYCILGLSIWLFRKLKNRWQVTYRWEYIAIFLVFAITGSTAGKVSDPIMQGIGLAKETTTGWLYWPVRILLIFPLYQVLLVFFGWVFGKYRFFKKFATKMASRTGLGIFFRKLP